MELTADATAAGWAAAILDFVSLHRGWAPAVVLVLSAAESVALLSFVVPSSAILVGVGALVAAGSLDLAPVWLAAVAGAFAGTTFSWWVGWRFGPSVLESRAFAAQRAAVARARGWFARWGIYVVFFGHLFAPLTSMVFLLAGVARIPFWRFQMANVPGAVIWAFFLPKSGELGGLLVVRIWALLSGG